MTVLYKEDFMELAGIVKHIASIDCQKPHTRLEVLIRDLAKFCAARNPKFSRESFMQACGSELIEHKRNCKLPSCNAENRNTDSIITENVIASQSNL